MRRSELIRRLRAESPTEDPQDPEVEILVSGMWYSLDVVTSAGPKLVIAYLPGWHR